MKWCDEAIILSVRSHGETAVIVELFTRNHGRTFGLMLGGQSRKRRPMLQMGNHVDATWNARLGEHLGRIQLELHTAYAARVLEDAAALAMLISMSSLIRHLPERDPHANLFEISIFVLKFINDIRVWPALYARWELTLLDELGFGLDLSSCAATHVRDNLVYVSPKSGKAVSEIAGAPYKDKLLPLPQFFCNQHNSVPSVNDVLNGLRLTGFFLTARLSSQQKYILPEARERMKDLLHRFKVDKV
ncbi:MAG: DNA repair protein RecO [Hyphomicrobiaceae bacterium hypho_1]